MTRYSEYISGVDSDYTLLYASAVVTIQNTSRPNEASHALLTGATARRFMHGAGYHSRLSRADCSAGVTTGPAAPAEDPEGFCSYVAASAKHAFTPVSAVSG